MASTIQFGCPFCGAVAEIEAQYAGCDILCPACNSVLQLPRADEGPAAEPEIVTLDHVGPPPLPHLPEPEEIAVKPPEATQPPPLSSKPKLWQAGTHRSASTATEAAAALPELPQPLAPAPRPAEPTKKSRNLPVVETTEPVEDSGGKPSAPRGAVARELDRKERARRRLVSNAIMLVASSLFMLAAAGVLMYLTGRK